MPHLRMQFIHLLFFCTFIISKVAMATEEPKFKLLEQEGAYELREYPTLLIAEVLVEGNMSEASGKGFRMLADFIFGNNQSHTGHSEKINMTAPVTIHAVSEKIDMSAPVNVQKQAQGWRVSFTMPQQYTIHSLPKPNNAQVSIKTIPSQKIAVLRFSGIANEEKMLAQVALLHDWLSQKHLKPIGLPTLARYNPPWTLPFLRRNEIMFTVE
jgi:hypothetical protein